MEAAILVICLITLISVCLCFRYVHITSEDSRDRDETILANLDRVNQNVLASVGENSDLATVLESVEDIREVLSEASRRNAVRNGEEVPAVPPKSGRKFIGVAERRRFAERASQGPIRHDERVRQNNVKAMEG